MSGIEQLLRDSYHDLAKSVGEHDMRPLALLQPLRRKRRSTVLAPVAAALAVIAVIAGVVAVPRLLAPAPVVAANRGATPFVVLLPYYGSDAPGRLVVQAAGTRRVTAYVPAPEGGAWAAVAATGSGTTFIAAATATRGCSTSLYSLELTPAGDVTSLRPLNAEIQGHTLPFLAASADSQTVAYVSSTCQKITEPGVHAETMGVLTLDQSGVSADRHRNLQQDAYLTSLSLSADGTLLTYVQAVDQGTGWLAAQPPSGAVWLVRLGSQAGPLQAGRVIVRGRQGELPVAGALTADGRTLYLLTHTYSAREPEGITLAAYRTSDGSVQRTLYIWRNVTPVSPALTAGGNQLLVWGIRQPGTYQVDPGTGRVTDFWVYTPAGEFPESLAW
jgi:hypothetical protein